MKLLVTKEIFESAPWYEDFKYWLMMELPDGSAEVFEFCIRECCRIASYIEGKKSEDILLDDAGISSAGGIFPFSALLPKSAGVGTMLAALRAGEIEWEKQKTSAPDLSNEDMKYDAPYTPFIANLVESGNKYRSGYLLSFLFPEKNDFDIAKESIDYFSNKDKEIMREMKEKMDKNSHYYHDTNEMMRKKIGELEQELLSHGEKLTTAQVTYLIEYAKLRDGTATAQEWATVLHLISGCSANALRQQLNSPNLSDGNKSRVKTLYDTKLKELKER